MARSLTLRDHALMARGASTGTIAGAIIGAAVAAILILLCSLPFILKCRRKRRLRRRQEQDDLHPEMGMPGIRSHSQTFSTHANRLSHMSQSRLASAAATLSDRDSQTGKEYGPDGITYHRSAAPSPALVGKTLRTCSPAPSIAMPASSASLAAGSRSDSPAVAQAPFTPPPEKEEMSRAPTFGTFTTEPEPLSRSPTESLHGAHPPSIGGTFRKFHDRVFHRDSTKSSGSDSHKTSSRSPDVDLDELAQIQTGASAPYLVDEKIPTGGSAAEYYSGAPLSPPEEPPLPISTGNTQFLHLMAMPAAALAGIAAPHTHVSIQQQQQQKQQPQQQQQHQQQSRSLGSPFNPPGAPLSPTSPFSKDDDLSSDEGERQSSEAKNDSLTPPQRGLRSPSPKRFEPPPSPSHPAPGTVNPMDMMKPSTAAEQAAWVHTELWKLENSPPPPPQLENSLPSQFESSPTPAPAPIPAPVSAPHSEPSPPPPPPPPSQQPQAYQPQQDTYPPSQPDNANPGPERPHFQAVVRHPTEMDVTHSGHFIPQHEEQVITNISDTSSPGPEFDLYAYGSSPLNHISPETGLTESAYTESPSPRSSTSQRPASSYGGTDYLEASPGDHSRPPSQASQASQHDGSPKPTSFACDICGSKFDQVHKLNHHKRYHERPHQCLQCDKRFGTKTHLDRHVNDKHNKTRKYHCTVPNCAYAKQGGGKSFPRKDNWRRHMQNKHSVQNPPEPVEEDVTMTDVMA